ncbi:MULTISPECIES: DUF2213 domain-containing protein [unclassified Clostridium]|uniref:DUF2213 domain-containing protein n=1 Tax=unclassified Clostridium TaxID=2614128 RepID=UPI0002979959|nr:MULTISPECIES: DUF2213 domain-containing protein [unclassified Clostridium]EKQ56277.1 MAG: hypothetical protein A370_02033 [Clostridium sp. Maddingley MBC34-26]
MKAFYGSRISENMTVTPDGFLVCHNVPIARTGWYDYLPQEIGTEGDGIVKVYRSPEEVFSKQAMASFEGKPTTDEHPPDLLTPDNSTFYTKGAVQNVRQSPTEQDLLLADLIIYNSTLIDEIMNKGKREVSCGYECNYVNNGDGTYSQVQICGNHVAVVEAGRAGDRVAIKDSKNQNIEGGKKKMKIPKQQRGPVTNFFAALGIKHFAKDAEPEEISEALDALAEERKDDEGEEIEKKCKPETSANDESVNPEVADLSQKVDKLTELVTQLVTSKANDEEKKPEDAIDELIGELSKGEKSTGDEEESVTVPVDEMDEDIPDGVVTDPEDRPENPISNTDSAAMIRALKAMKPVIAAIKDPSERKKACDSLMAEFKKSKKTTSKDNGYQKILNAQRKNSQTKAQKASDSKEKQFDDIQNSYAKKNSHYKGEK